MHQGNLTAIAEGHFQEGNGPAAGSKRMRSDLKPSARRGSLGITRRSMRPPSSLRATTSNRRWNSSSENRDGDEAPACAYDAEGAGDVIHSIGTLQTDSRARQGIDQRAELPGQPGAFFIECGVRCFLPVVKNGYRLGIAFLKISSAIFISKSGSSSRMSSEKMPRRRASFFAMASGVSPMGAGLKECPAAGRFRAWRWIG